MARCLPQSRARWWQDAGPKRGRERRGPLSLGMLTWCTSCEGWDSRGFQCTRTRIGKMSGCVGADADFAASQGIAFAVEALVIRIVIFAEGAERVFADPAIDGQIAAWNVGVAQKFGAAVVRRAAKKLRPGSVRAIGCFKGRNLFLDNFKLPDDNEHKCLDPGFMVAQADGCADITNASEPTLGFQHALQRLLRGCT